MKNGIDYFMGVLIGLTTFRVVFTRNLFYIKTTYPWKSAIKNRIILNTIKEQDKSSDIEQQPPFGQRKLLVT